MSDDKRLGSNPLSWMSTGTQQPADIPLGKKAAPVVPEAPVDTPAPEPSAPTAETTPPPAQEVAPTPNVGAEPTQATDHDPIFTAPTTISEEESMGKGKIKIKQTMDAAQAAAHLRDLAESLESGIVRAENADNSIIVGVSDNLQFEMKLSSKKDKVKCEVEMEWKDDGAALSEFSITGK